MVAHFLRSAGNCIPVQGPSAVTQRMVSEAVQSKGRQNPYRILASILSDTASNGKVCRSQRGELGAVDSLTSQTV